MGSRLPRCRLTAATEEAAEELDKAAKKLTAGAKAQHIFNDLTARVNSCPSQNRPNRSFSAACEVVPFPKTCVNQSFSAGCEAETTFSGLRYA
jgi:hypothetical protein